MDEPTNGLDRQGLDLLREWVDECRRRGTAVVMAGHYLEEMDAVCDKLFELNQGTLSSSQRIPSPTRWLVATRTYDVLEKIRDAVDNISFAGTKDGVPQVILEAPIPKQELVELLSRFQEFDVTSLTPM
jgi:ABC-2 type transport system ATP-binding protein